MPADAPDPAELCAAVRSLLATPPASSAFQRRLRLARRLLDQHPELRATLAADDAVDARQTFTHRSDVADLGARIERQTARCAQLRAECAALLARAGEQRARALRVLTAATTARKHAQALHESAVWRRLAGATPRRRLIR